MVIKQRMSSLILKKTSAPIPVFPTQDKRHYEKQIHILGVPQVTFTSHQQSKHPNPQLTCDRKADTAWLEELT